MGWSCQWVAAVLGSRMTNQTLQSPATFTTNQVRAHFFCHFHERSVLNEATISKTNAQTGNEDRGGEEKRKFAKRKSVYSLSSCPPSMPAVTRIQYNWKVKIQPQSLVTVTYFLSNPSEGDLSLGIACSHSKSILFQSQTQNFLDQHCM